MIDPHYPQSWPSISWQNKHHILCIVNCVQIYLLAVFESGMKISNIVPTPVLTSHSQGWLWSSKGCVCECKRYQISIYHHTLSKTLLMLSPQCILTIISYKTNSNSGGNSRHRTYIYRRHHIVVVLRIKDLSFCLLNGGFMECWIKSSSFNGRKR